MKSKVLLPFATLTSIIIAGGVPYYNAYQYSVKPSPFELAAKKLGLNNYQQQALVKTFNYAGYFEREHLWKDTVTFANLTNHDPKKIYSSVTTTLQYSLQKGLDEPDSKLVVKNLLKDIDLPAEDAVAWIVFTSQNAFGRKVGEERDVLANNAVTNRHSEKLLQALEEFGLVNEIPPKLEQYTEVWIMGAASSRLEKHIEYYKNLKIENVGEIKLLAGERPLSPELDEKNLMVQLAKDNDIPFNQQQPFIQTQGKLYFNYEPPNGRKLTETLMAQYFNHTLLSGKAIVIDTKSENNIRPTTESTARDATKALREKINNGEYTEQKIIYVLAVSNQPHIKRQEVIVQSEVDKLLNDNGLDTEGYKINIDGCGSKADTSSKNLRNIMSEQAALIAEQSKPILAQPKHKKIQEKLLYQNREEPSPLPPLPEEQKKGIMTTAIETIQDLIQHYVDLKLTGENSEDLSLMFISDFKGSNEG